MSPSYEAQARIPEGSPLVGKGADFELPIP